MSHRLPMNAPHRARAGGRARRRGISLIEAMVAMAVMGFGMLGVLGLQATLRANADLSKQRNEATRLAEEKIEELRSFSVIATTAGAKAYADLASGTITDTPWTSGTNTTYTRAATVAESTPPGHKTLSVDISWADRTGTTHNVRLYSAVAEVAPDLAATMVATPVGGGTRGSGARRAGIPPQAKNFGDGTSGFRPPQTATSATVWVFNNNTGLITSVCQTTAANNAALTLAALTSCSSSQKYQLISGFLRFHTNGAQATALGLANPPPSATPPTIDPNSIVAEVAQTSPVIIGSACFHEDEVATDPQYRAYFCAVPVDISTTPQYAWTGALQINMASLATRAMTSPTDTDPTHRRVCRYRAAASYALVDTTGPLANQNLVLTEAPFSCTTTPVVAYQHQP